MHLEGGSTPRGYLRHQFRKGMLLLGGGLLLGFLFLLALSLGAVSIPPGEVLRTLLGEHVSPRWDMIVLQIRLPHALAAVVAGWALASAGVVMQSVLRNPLASPFTLGIASAGAFGAAFSVILLGTGVMRSRMADAVQISSPLETTGIAFLFCLLASGIVLLISRMRRASPEAMILAGVALNSLFSAGTMFLQYFATDVQLAAVVFWSFGDVGRAGWRELWIMALVVGVASLFFFRNVWNYNAMDSGDETALGLGVPVARLRMWSLGVASLLTAVVVAFLGVIGFVGLVAPHMTRRILGDDHRFLLPGAAFVGACLLLAADTTARLILAPHVLPVAILTAFLGAPVFLWLLCRRSKKTC